MLKDAIPVRIDVHKTEFGAYLQRSIAWVALDTLLLSCVLGEAVPMAFRAEINNPLDRNFFEGLGLAAVNTRRGATSCCFHLNGNSTLMDPDQDLNAQLRMWKVNAEVPPSFQPNVWRAIAVRERAAERPVFPARWLEFLMGRLGQPRYAVPFGILTLTVSLGLARVQADAANGRTWRTLETRYVASVDPVAMAETNR